MPSVAQPHFLYGWKLTSSNITAIHLQKMNYYSGMHAHSSSLQELHETLMPDTFEKLWSCMNRHEYYYHILWIMRVIVKWCCMTLHCCAKWKARRGKIGKKCNLSWLVYLAVYSSHKIQVQNSGEACVKHVFTCCSERRCM